MSESLLKLGTRKYAKGWGRSENPEFNHHGLKVDPYSADTRPSKDCCIMAQVQGCQSQDFALSHICTYILQYVVYTKYMHPMIDHLIPAE